MLLSDKAMASEFASIFESLRKCLELRDKYMLVSGQRLGFNPKDHDGHFFGLPDGISDVSGVRPNADIGGINAPTSSPLDPWRIYPKPPPPHWHWKDRNLVAHDSADDEEFVFEECKVPGPDGWNFEIDEKGVFQVYDETDSKLLRSICHLLQAFIGSVQILSTSLVSKSQLSVNTSWIWSMSSGLSQMAPPRVSLSGV